MASLRLTFPEKDEPTVIALTGARLTIGRLPFNTIQIIDRTVSGFHAELISEHGHYRLHDRGSSNGTFVNGQKVADFHLSEPCTITFGTVEAQFSPEAVAPSEDAESFPTRSEINAVRKENIELKATVEALREETSALRQVRPLESGDVALAVTKEEFDKVVIERETLKEERLKQDEEITRLKTDLAVLKRDRVNLQLAYDGLQREIADLRTRTGAIEQIAFPPKAAAEALAAQDPAPDEEIRVEVPIPIAEEQPAPSDQIPAEAEASESPVTPPVPVAAPVVPKAPLGTPLPPKAPFAPSSPMKPFAPVPKAVAATAGGMPAKAPMGLGSGIRPLGAKPPAVAENDAAALPDADTTRLSPRPLPSVKLPPQPTVKMAAVPLPKAGPKGTQKLS